MKIAVSGATGFIGRNLISELKKESHEVIILNRSLLYNETDLEKEISGTDVLVHLAGAPILQRWTEKAKTEIMNSRTVTTRNLIKVINRLPESHRPGVFISASAVGIYSLEGSHSEESTSFANNFVGEVVQKWEKSSEELNHTVRRVIFRIGLVLGSESKIIRQLLSVFKLGLGGKIGSGNQPFPFIHVLDLISAILWAIKSSETHGIYNLVAPQQITNADFTKNLAGLLNCPAIFPVPPFALKLIYGEAASLVLKNPQVFPRRLINEGFRYSFPKIPVFLTRLTTSKTL